MLVGGGVPVHYNLPTEHHKRNMPDFGAMVNKTKLQVTVLYSL